jgi:hypothetical protein
MPSAVNPVSEQRQVSAALTLVRRDVGAALVRREAARVWLRWRQGPGHVDQGVEVRQPGDIARKETSPFRPIAPLPTPSAGPISDKDQTDLTEKE